jgi:hypothetical protein
MPIRSSAEVALLLAVIFKRSGEKRARVSEKTLKMLGFRKRLRCKFWSNVASDLADLGLNLIELDAGGFALIPSKSLEAARTITAKRWLNENELRAVKNGKPIDVDALWQELEEDENLASEDDTDS